MGTIRFISDLHLGHNKEFLYVPRGFSSIEDHNVAIVTNWNNIVNDDDDVYVLGDLVLGDVDHGIHLLSLLKGRIHVIRGNHDTDMKAERYKELPNVVEVVWATQIKYQKANFYLSHYITQTANDIDTSPWKKHIVNLHGHTHQMNKFTYKDSPYTYCVCADAINCTPISIDEIIDDIRKKKGELNNDKTNIS